MEAISKCDQHPHLNNDFYCFIDNKWMCGACITYHNTCIPKPEHYAEFCEKIKKNEKGEIRDQIVKNLKIKLDELVQ